MKWHLVVTIRLKQLIFQYITLEGINQSVNILVKNALQLMYTTGAIING